MSKRNPLNPRRGEVWEVNLTPTIGSESQKILTAVIVSSDGLEPLAIRLVVPLTSWKDHFSENIWHVYIKPSAENGLIMDSAADITQSRWFEVNRFIRRHGRLNALLLQEITAAIAAIIELK